MMGGLNKIELLKAPHETDEDLQIRIKAQMRNMKRDQHKAREFIIDH